MASPTGFSLNSFEPSALQNSKISPDDATWAEFNSNSQIYSLISQYVARECPLSSFRIEVNEGARSSDGCCDSDSDMDEDVCVVKGEDKTRYTTLSAGIGLHEFLWEGKNFAAVVQTNGCPVGTDCGAQLYQTLVLVVEGKGNSLLLQQFTGELVAASMKVKPNYFTIYRWHNNYQYWRTDRSVAARPLESVILPETEKTRLVDDMKEFLSKDTSEWYTHHGIPYKRSYLFYGTPGAGKTSMIQALAGKFKRNVCYVQPSHPKMTDDSFIQALQKTPKNSILVLEDIDALFGKDRSKRCKDSPLTFTGLLNALDGIGNSSGQIFVLTTNFRENLDAALIRNGRVDVHIRFEHANDEQIMTLWKQFKGDGDASAKNAKSFLERVRAGLEGQPICMAALQNFFILTRRMTCEESLDSVHLISEEVHSRNETQASPAAKPEEKKGDEKRPHKTPRKTLVNTGTSTPSGPMNVYINVNPGTLPTSTVQKKHETEEEEEEETGEEEEEE